MSTVEQIKSAIETLSPQEREELELWLHGSGDDDWDRQMKADAAAGKFDRIIAEVDAEIDSGELRDMP